MKHIELLYRKEELRDVLEKGNVVIYGAGRVARTVIKFAARNFFSIDEIWVSEKKGNPNQIMGVPVCEITGEMKEEEINLIVCVMENLHEEIAEKILPYSIQNVYSISNKLYGTLTYQMGDYDIDKLYEINSLIGKVREMFAFMQDRLSRDNTIYWSNSIEKKIIKENWGNVSETNDFAEKYLKLIKGLDWESIETITRILNRQKIYLNSELKKIDLFTSKEKEELKVLKENFSDLIISLSNDLYMYKNYLLPCNHFEGSVFFYKHGIHKVKNLEKIKGTTVIDVGGFVGDSVLVLSELLPSKIVSFEAVPEHYKLLNKTIKLNSIKNVEAVNCALGKENGTIVMNLHGSSSTFVERKGIDFNGAVEVPVITFDQYVKENKLKNIGLIKVDIEGAEPDFLEGAKETITKYKPVLLLSIYHNAHDFFELKPMIEAWNLEYKFTIYKPTNGNITNETLLIAEVY